MAPLIDTHPGRDVGFDAALVRAGKLAPVDPTELDLAEPRTRRRQAGRERSTLVRARWWYPIVVVFMLCSTGYFALRTDQQVAALLIWPTEGSQFVESADSAADPTYRDSMTIVAGGLNRKSGNLIADALLPSIGGPDGRVFSLVYGSGIYDGDINAKFDALFEKYRPNRLVLYGNSMGGDVVLNIALHFQQTYADPGRYPDGQIVPSIDIIYLDCTPMSTDDVRYSARTRADFLTGLTEKVGTDGGAATRLAAEMLVQRKQWSTGSYPFLIVDPHRFGYKWDEVWREKLNPTGVSTALVKDQYGVIRRFDAERVFQGLAPETDIAYLRPAVGDDDNTIDVDQVEMRLTELATQHRLDLTVIDVPGGSHASAVRDATTYNPLISDFQRTAIVTRVGELIR